MVLLPTSKYYCLHKSDNRLNLKHTGVNYQSPIFITTGNGNGGQPVPPEVPPEIPPEVPPEPPVRPIPESSTVAPMFC